VEYIYYSKREVRQRILNLMEELEEKVKNSHPRSFFALTYASRRERYLELLRQLESGQPISAFVMSKLFHKGARYEPDEEEAKYFYP
jgi:hypothetical protein